MFKGIVTDTGTIMNVSTYHNEDQIFCIKTNNLFSINKGDSVACSGACLTITDVTDNIFKVQVSQETLKVTNLSAWEIGTKINLEQAMRLSDRIDGHIVQGHVDSTVKIIKINRSVNSHEIELICPQKLVKFIAQKGSVTLNGVSLTINSVTDQKFTVNIIPYTWHNTTFQYIKINDCLNLEVDIIARYLDQLMRYKDN